jgi:hypothetical protein
MENRSKSNRFTPCARGILVTSCGIHSISTVKRPRAQHDIISNPFDDYCQPALDELCIDTRLFLAVGVVQRLHAPPMRLAT